MSIKFVSTSIITSSDGIQHDEIKRIQPEATSLGGGLQIINRDEEKLKSREGTSLTLFEQLQQNKEDKDDDWESQLRESRMPKALDDEEVAFLEEQDAKVFQARRQHEKQEMQDVLEFRAARSAFEKDSTKGGGSGNSTSTFSSSSLSSGQLCPAPRVKLKLKLKRKRQGEVTRPSAKKKTENTGTKRSKNSSDEPVVNSSLTLIANYASSSDDDE